MENAVVYARYSSHSQNDQSIDGQLAEAMKFAISHNYHIIAQYVDRAKSGRTDNREQFQKMLKDTAKKQFTVIIVWKVDRFGRNREEIAINKMKCRKNGVRVEYVAEKIPDTPEGVILESVLEGFAEYYSLQLSQNIKRGIMESAKMCKSTGNNISYGYKTGKDKEIIIDESKAPIVLRIFQKYADGETLSNIVDWLNESGYRGKMGKPFTVSSVSRFLKNEQYRGVYNSHNQHIEEGIPRIVDDELFFKVQDRFKSHTSRQVRGDYLLTNKLFCGKCGSQMNGESGTGKGKLYHYYTCYKRKTKKACDKKPVRKNEIENIVIDLIKRLLQNDELLEKIADKVWEAYLKENDNSDEIEALKKQIADRESRLNNLLHLSEKVKNLPELDKRLVELQTEKSELEESLAIAEKDNILPNRNYITAFFKYLRQQDISEKKVQRKLIKTFVNKVYVFDDKLIVTFNVTDANNQEVSIEAIADGESFGFSDSCSTICKVVETIVFLPTYFAIIIRKP